MVPLGCGGEGRLGPSSHLGRPLVSGLGLDWHSTEECPLGGPLETVSLGSRSRGHVYTLGKSDFVRTGGEVPVRRTSPVVCGRVLRVGRFLSVAFLRSPTSPVAVHVTLRPETSVGVSRGGDVRPDPTWTSGVPDDKTLVRQKW